VSLAFGSEQSNRQTNVSHVADKGQANGDMAEYDVAEFAYS
jgi:hypothetical protein